MTDIYIYIYISASLSLRSAPRWTKRGFRSPPPWAAARRLSAIYIYIYIYIYMYI